MNHEIRCQSIYVSDATNTTVTVLPANPGVTYTIYGYDISVANADTLNLLTGSNKRAGYYFGADSGLVRSIHPLFIRSNPGDSVSIQKGSATTPVQITVFYVTDNP